MPDSRYKSSMTTIQKNTIATFIAAIVHLSGAIGMLYSSHADWFIGMTPYNLLLMAVLVLWTQEEASQPFYLFINIIKPFKEIIWHLKYIVEMEIFHIQTALVKT